MSEDGSLKDLQFLEELLMQMDLEQDRRSVSDFWQAVIKRCFLVESFMLAHSACKSLTASDQVAPATSGSAR